MSLATEKEKSFHPWAGKTATEGVIGLGTIGKIGDDAQNEVYTAIAGVNFPLHSMDRKSLKALPKGEGSGVFSSASDLPGCARLCHFADEIADFFACSWPTGSVMF
jgi:hypothetical protein